MRAASCSSLLLYGPSLLLIINSSSFFHRFICSFSIFFSLALREWFQRIPSEAELHRCACQFNWTQSVVNNDEHTKASLQMNKNKQTTPSTSKNTPRSIKWWKILNIAIYAYIFGRDDGMVESNDANKPIELIEMETKLSWKEHYFKHAVQVEFELDWTMLENFVFILIRYKSLNCASFLALLSEQMQMIETGKHVKDMRYKIVVVVFFVCFIGTGSYDLAISAMRGNDENWSFFYKSCGIPCVQLCICMKTNEYGKQTVISLKYVCMPFNLLFIS